MLQIMNIMSQSLEGFSPLYERDGHNPRLDSYKEVFAKWESHLRALYCKPSSLAMFFCWANVGHEASVQLQR